MNKIDNFRGKYAFLSNYYNSPISEYLEDGTIITYPTVEHAFQAAKTTDKKMRQTISYCTAPGDAKRIGRHVSLRNDWNEIKTAVMLTYIREKFKDPVLRAKLLATGDAYLEEGNTWDDRIWGTVNGEGENCLGKILMQVREEARQGKLPIYTN